MNEIKIFENSEFGTLRGVEIDGDPWFAATDVCKALEIGNPSQALARLDDDEKITTIISNEGAASGKSSMAFVNEPGLYALVLGSRKPEAKAFRRWITHEVIPAIRKTGGYIAGENDMTDDELLARALNVMKIKLEQREAQLNRAEAEKSKLQVENAIMAPKAEYFDDLIDRNLLTNFRNTAKQLKVQERKFIAFLLEKKYIYRDKHGRLLPTAAKNDGLFEVKDSINEKTGFTCQQTMVTPKGKEVFRLLTQGI